MMTTPGEHLKWCVLRALAYVDIGDPDTACDSLMSDLHKLDDAAGGLAAMLEYDLPAIMRSFLHGRPTVENTMRDLGLPLDNPDGAAK